jgi:hypothetical protein
MTTKQRILTAAIATGMEMNLILFGPAIANAGTFFPPTGLPASGPFLMAPSDPGPSPSGPSDSGSSSMSSGSSIDIPRDTGPNGPQGVPGGPPPNSGPPGPPPPNSGPPDNRPWRPPRPPWWWWQLQDQNTCADGSPGPVCTDTDIQPTTCQLLPHDVQTPPPFQYQNQTVTPNWDDNLQQWGFWFNGKWNPLYAKGC